MGLPADLVAFFEEHRRCGSLDGGVERGRVWMAGDCGGWIGRRVEYRDAPLRRDNMPRNSSGNGG
ncbi:MAG: hypothetical protein ACRD1B_08630 [Thermoanaerobaculia bacterium]